ncbi:WD40-repeat-containing domain protein [Coniochaeta sp. 2T2.1]|nr:WD40-repeat-containing domain protein [Coniochaeta sp. 2T2.1]
MPPVTSSPASASLHSPAQVDRQRSQQVSLRWDEEDAGTRRPARLQFEVAECVETKTITTTTTTRRSYPPLFVREPRSLQSLDSKEYPLASRPTPPELSQVTLDMPDFDAERWSLDNEPSTMQIEGPPLVDHATGLKHEPAIESPNSPGSPAYESLGRPSIPSVESQIQTRRSKRTSTRTASPTYKAGARSSQRLNKNHGLSLHYEVSDKLRRVATSKSDRSRSFFKSGYLATPDTTETASGGLDRTLRAMSPDTAVDADLGTTQSTLDAESPAASESHTIFSSNVATPPITDADLVPFSDNEAPVQQTARQLPPRPTINTVAAQDASLPSPRLSPTLAAGHSHSSLDQDAEVDDEDAAIFSRQLMRRDRRGRRQWFDESQTTDEGDGSLLAPRSDGSTAQDDSWVAPPNFADARSMLENFDAMPSEMKSFMMYQFLRRCPRKTLRMVATTVNPALKCDFLKELPLELSLHVLSYLGHRDLCRAAQVSKHWRNTVDSNETGWKELFDRDGFVLPAGELRTAIQQGWGWQDPIGAGGCEVDLSHQNRLTASDADLIRQTPVSKLRSTKRKRSSLAPSATSERVKRRASAQQEHLKDDYNSPLEILQHKSEGPISAANQAAIAVPDPHVGLPSLRKLHLFKSLYRRHYMIKQNWTSGEVKPSHVAFTAHPRHVITCLQFDDDKIITGSDDTLIHVYDTKTGKLRKKLEGHEGGVWALQYEGNILVSGSTDRSVRVWDIEKGICTQVFYGHTSTVRCLQILMPTDTGRRENGRKVMVPSKPLIITGSRDSQLRVWRLPEATSRRYIQTGPPANDSECPFFIRILTGHAHSVRAISAHEDTLVSGSYDSTVRVWRISTGEQLHVLHGHSAKVYSVVLDHKRNRCISGSMDSLVKIWDLDTGACLYTLEGHSLLVGLLDLRDDRLVSAAADSTLRIWDPENGRCKNTLQAHTGAITCFQHDGQKVISGSEKTVKMWDIQTGDCVQDLLTNLSGVWQVKFDQRRCVAAVQRDNLTYIEILDFGAIRDGVPPEELGKRKLLNEAEVQRLLAEEP